MFKIPKGLEKNEWIKPQILIKNIDLTAPASGVRANTLVLCREYFKSRLRNDFYQSVSMEHNFLLYRVVPKRNSLPDDVVTFSTRYTFKSAHDRYTKLFNCYIPKGLGFLI